ncbi:MAG: methylamine dehydrogenase accessory protein MauD, partial [Actinomycetota bacterium]|nr:methylamine dehydrogenase accessory protein MauD [Actinomycetota bacterium]
MSLVFAVSYAALWILVSVVAVVTLICVRQIGLLHRRIPPTGARVAHVGPSIGAIAPTFQVAGIGGEMVT